MIIELLFVLHQTNNDIIYIFHVVENFVHLFGKCSKLLLLRFLFFFLFIFINLLLNYMKVVTYALERPFSFKLIWAPEVQYAIFCLLIQVSCK